VAALPDGTVQVAFLSLCFSLSLSLSLSFNLKACPFIRWLDVKLRRLEQFESGMIAHIDSVLGLLQLLIIKLDGPLPPRIRTKT